MLSTNLSLIAITVDYSGLKQWLITIEAMRSMVLSQCNQVSYDSNQLNTNMFSNFNSYSFLITIISIPIGLMQYKLNFIPSIADCTYKLS